MDPNTMRLLGNERYESIVRDADVARSMALTGSRLRRSSRHAVGERVSDIADVAKAVDRSLRAVLRCRWREAERAVAGLKRVGAVPSARLAIAAILARLTGDRREADKASATLRLALPDSGGDPYTWTAITVALALQEWAGVNHGSEAVPSLLPASTDLIRTLCSRAQSVGGESTDLLCLSLALHARVVQSPVLGSFLLGHLSEDASPAGRAAMGLGFVALGDRETGRRILLGVVDSASGMRVPLVEGLVDAELARLDHDGGDDLHAHQWIERTDRFTEQYGCPLPAKVGRAAS